MDITRITAATYVLTHTPIEEYSTITLFSFLLKQSFVVNHFIDYQTTLLWVNILGL